MRVELYLGRCWEKGVGRRHCALRLCGRRRRVVDVRRDILVLVVGLKEGRMEVKVEEDDELMFASGAWRAESLGKPSLSWIHAKCLWWCHILLLRLCFNLNNYFHYHSFTLFCTPLI